MVDLPENDQSNSGTSNVLSEEFFEEELYLSKDQAGKFLIELGEQLKEGNEITLSREDWELPFTFDEPVELEIEFSGNTESELEIELELQGAQDDPTPNIS